LGVEVKNDLFEIESNSPTRGEQNKYLYPEFLKYRKLRGSDPEKAQEAFSKIILWMDPLVVRYCWAAKKWPKRDDFHESYYRDLFRLRKFGKLNMRKDDLLQEMRLFVIEKFRQYRVRHTAPPGGYISRSLFYCTQKFWRKQVRMEVNQNGTKGRST